MSNSECMSARAVLWVMVLSGFAINYMVRVNINIAIVAMVYSRGYSLNHQSNHSTVSECFTAPNITWTSTSTSDLGINNLSAFLIQNFSSDTAEQGNVELEDGLRFHWDEYEQNLVLSAFFWTMWITQIPGGVLAQRFGTKLVFGLSQLTSALLASFIPVAARLGGFRFIFALRLLQGLISGFTWPAMHTLIGKWVPPDERSKFVSAYLGSSLGAALTFPLCGLLMATLGWEAVFYATGLLGAAWSLAWFLLIFDSPQQHPRISQTEREYIEDKLGVAVQQSGRKLATPWCSIITSLPVWMNTLSQWGAIWGLFTLLTQAPTYFKLIHGFDIRMTGLLSGIPHLSRIIFALAFSVLADRLLDRKIMSCTAVRKFATFVGCVVSGLCMLGLAFMGCNAMGAVILLTASTAIGGASSSGPLACIVDLSPNFAGVVFGIVSAVSVFPGFLSPMIVGILTFENQTVSQWKIVFIIAAAMQLVTGMLFMFFGSAELQPWNDPGSSSEEEEARRAPLVKKQRTIVRQAS